MSEPRGADSVLMGNAARVHMPAAGAAVRSRRLLRLAGDDRLAVLVQRGNDAAFEVAFERHGPAVLGFCRHMLGSPEEAEDALQHTFAAAYRDLQRGADREIALKPWLFTIARNRCLSVLRARRELAVAESEVATAGLAEQVEQRAELRQLLADVRELPDEQRAALLLAEVGGLPQADIAAVLGCEVRRVKALVFRARSALVARREARAVDCETIREQLANLRGGSLRRTELRLHLRDCPGCRDFREQVRRQRQMLSAALPVAPTVALKTSVLAAVGIGGGAAGGGAAAGGAAIVGGATVAKIAAVAAIAAGGAVVVEHETQAPPVSPSSNSSGQGVGTTGAAERGAAAPGSANLAEPRREGSISRGVGRAQGSDDPGRRPIQVEGAGPPGQLGPKAPGRGRGRGPIETPPKDTPVRRGPPAAKVRPERPVKPQHEPRGLTGQKQPSEQSSESANPGAQGKANGRAKGEIEDR
jgi:RNA polymerase sigma factor (sigma-70 family)